MGMCAHRRSKRLHLCYDASTVAGGMSTAFRVSRPLAIVVTVMALLWSLVVPAAAITPLATTDVASFASRAEQWAEARAEQRSAANEAAAELAVGAREAEAAREAAAEAQLAADLERERLAAITTVPPPTAPPTTAPPTTAAPTTAPPTTTPPVTTPDPVAPAPAGGPTAAQWEALRRCESSGNYSIVNPDGRFRGAYQFSVGTWDWIAGMHRPDLVGVDPAAAAPADQDAMALALWQRNGWGPWPHCGRIAAAA